MLRSAVKRIAQRGGKTIARELAPACILLFISCFMLLIFEPILMYASNMDEFWFDFPLMIGPVLIAFVMFFLAGIIMIAAIYFVNLLITDRLLLYKLTLLAGFIVFFLLYLQGNWLSGNLPQLTGAKIAWENYGKQETIVFVSAAVILVGSAIVSLKKKGFDRTIFYAAAGAAVVFLMLSAALVSALLTNNVLDRKSTFFDPNLKNYNTVSSNKNFLIFLIDETHSQVFYDIMMEDDDFRGMMEDFTYYPDTLGVYPYTDYALPTILAGATPQDVPNYREYCNSAYNQSPLFEKLSQNGYEINLYSYFTWDGEKKFNIENTALYSDKFIDTSEFIKQELKYISFKYLPYGLKHLSIKGSSINFGRCKGKRSEYGSYQWETAENYRYITENSVLDKQSNNYFQFVHCQGCHPPLIYDKDLHTLEDGTYEQQAAATLTVVKAYLQRLKDNNAYDNSVIVIMADHGTYLNDPASKDALTDRLRPALFIKGIHEKHEMLVSDRPVSHADLQDAFCDLIDGKQSTDLFEECEPGRTRTMYLYGYEFPGEKIEYSTTGTASEVEKFIPTGTVYHCE